MTLINTPKPIVALAETTSPHNTTCRGNFQTIAVFNGVYALDQTTASDVRIIYY